MSDPVDTTYRIRFTDKGKSEYGEAIVWYGYARPCGPFVYFARLCYNSRKSS